MLRDMAAPHQVWLQDMAPHTEPAGKTLTFPFAPGGPPGASVAYGYSYFLHLSVACFKQSLNLQSAARRSAANFASAATTHNE